MENPAAITFSFGAMLVVHGLYSVIPNSRSAAQDCSNIAQSLSPNKIFLPVNLLRAPKLFFSLIPVQISERGFVLKWLAS